MVIDHESVGVVCGSGDGEKPCGRLLVRAYVYAAYNMGSGL